MRIPQPFLILVGAGVLAGIAAALWRARRDGLPRPAMIDFLWTLLLGGWAGAVLFKTLYDPAAIAEAPAGAFTRFHGIVSFGGILGGMAASALYCHLRGWAWIPLAGAAAWAFPFGWALGRLGCTVARDHPGIRSEGWLAVAYPGGSRYDLGLLEFLFVMGIAAAWLIWKPVRPGLRAGVLLAVYGIFRIGLDTLHVDPPRYAGISVDQAAGFLTSAIGVWIIARAYRVPAAVAEIKTT